MVIITFVVQVFEFYGWLQSAENKVLDLLLRTRSTERPAVVTLEIDDQSFKRCFGNSSPLDPRALLRTVNMVDQTGAAAIGIDILTDDGAYLNASLEEWKKEYWIADSPAERQSLSAWDWVRGRTAELTVHPDKVFGREPELSVDHTSWGIPVFPADEDSSIRKTYQQVRLDGEAGALLWMPAWALTLARRYCAVSGKCGENDMAGEGRESELLFVTYGGQPIDRFQFRDVFRCDAAIAPETKSSSCGLSLQRRCLEPLQDGSLAGVFRSHVKDKILLIGGAYRAARDTYETPVGSLPGVAINGYAVRSQIQGSLLPEENRPVAILIDLVAGWSLIALKRRWTRRTMLSVALAIVLLTISAEFFLIGRQFIPGCVAILFGMMIHLILHAHDEEIEHQKQKPPFVLILRRFLLLPPAPPRSRTPPRHRSAP